MTRFLEIACAVGLMLSVPAGLHAQDAAPADNDRSAAPFVTNALGDSSADLVYTPVTPCRVFDTRASAAGILAGGTQRNFFVAGSIGFATQGGNAMGCGIPFGPHRATAVVINFAAVTPSGNGNLRAWAIADPQPPPPSAAVMNFSPALPALANGVVVPICDDAATSCVSGDLRLQADVSSVHVVGDVLGYFQRPGQIMSGMISGRYVANSGFFILFASYPVPLPLPPTPLPVFEYVPMGTTATCPGVGQAGAGRFCLYPITSSNIGPIAVSGSGNTRYGMSVDVTPSVATSAGFFVGNWAVRLP